MMRAKDRLTVEEWFERANQFEVASHALFDRRPEEAKLTLGLPHVVLRAFGVEAFLKCLIEMDNRKAPHWHNLAMLFKKLRVEDRRELRTRWKAEYQPKMRAWNLQKNKGSMKKKLPLSLDGALKLGGDAFVVFRYLPEKGVASFVLMNFPLVIRDYILELQPDLKSKLGNVRLIDPEPKFVEGDDKTAASVDALLAELNRQATPFNIKLRRSPNPKDGGSK